MQRLRYFVPSAALFLNFITRLPLVTFLLLLSANIQTFRLNLQTCFPAQSGEWSAKNWNVIKVLVHLSNNKADIKAKEYFNVYLFCSALFLLIEALEKRGNNGVQILFFIIDSIILLLFYKVSLALINLMAISSFFHWDLLGGWQGILTDWRMSWILSWPVIRPLLFFKLLGLYCVLC